MAGLTALGIAALMAILFSAGVMSGLSGFGFSAIGALSLLLLKPTLAVPLLMALSTINQLLSLEQLLPLSDDVDLARLCKLQYLKNQQPR